MFKPAMTGLITLGLIMAGCAGKPVEPTAFVAGTKPVPA